MRITDIREKTVAVGAPARSAAIGFSAMTASALVIVTDRVRHGRPLVGLAFDSVGRYGHGGLLRERFIPRLLAADPESYLDPATGLVDPFKAWSIVMRDEKPGGHGERPGAVGLIDAALWDLCAKAVDVPLWRLLADRFNGGRAPERVAVYASGGHYPADGDAVAALTAELAACRARGFTAMKIKIAGAPLAKDLRRIEAALAVVGDGASLAVDANAALTRDGAFAYAEALAPYRLAWFEEPVDPLDFALYAELCAAHDGPVGSGENLFSAADLGNLLRHGGLRPDRDLLQIDVSLSYGIVEYLRVLEVMAAHGWGRDRAAPHAGHLLALNVVAGLGLGLHETASAPAHATAGFADGVAVEDGSVPLPEAPGVGIEAKAGLYAHFRDLLG